jgi:hypothetical protein
MPLQRTLHTQGLIAENLFSISFEKEALGNSYIYFGGYSQPKNSNITWYDLVTSGNNKNFWTLKSNALKYGSTSVGNISEVILDTGYSQIILPKKVFDAMIKAINKNCTQGASYWQCKCTSENSLDSFNIDLGDGRSISVKDTQWTTFDKSAGICYLFVTHWADSATTHAILGDSFLRGKTIIHDSKNMKIGFFSTAYEATSGG